MSHKHQVSIIIPVYNELDNVQPLYNEIAQALPGETFDFEVIYVDDGSNDGTREKLTELSHQHEQLIVVKHAGNYGQSAGLVSGARAAKYPWLVTLDGDGQNDPADIPKLFDVIVNDEEAVVLGNRKKRDDNALRKLSSRVGNGIRRSLLHDDCPDTGCSLKLFPRSAFLQLPHFNHLHRYLPALFKRAGFRVVNVPVNHRPRLHGVSKYGVMNRLFVGIHDLIGVRWLMKRPCQAEICNE
jgi:dolichol-phosphate mannosyltransferase